MSYKDLEMHMMLKKEGRRKEKEVLGWAKLQLTNRLCHVMDWQNRTLSSPPCNTPECFQVSKSCNFSSWSHISSPRLTCFTILKMWLPKLIGCCLSIQPQGRKSKGKRRWELWARIETVKYHCCSHSIVWKVSQDHTYLQRMLGNETYPCAQKEE